MPETSLTPTPPAPTADTPAADTPTADTSAADTQVAAPPGPEAPRHPVAGAPPGTVEPSGPRPVVPKPTGAFRGAVLRTRTTCDRLLRRLGGIARRDDGMTTAEYAVGTVAAVAFGGVLYKVVTSDAVVSGLTALIGKALNADF
jgi:hypothetical protein